MPWPLWCYRFSGLSQGRYGLLRSFEFLVNENRCRARCRCVRPAFWSRTLGRNVLSSTKLNDRYVKRYPTLVRIARGRQVGRGASPSAFKEVSAKGRAPFICSLNPAITFATSVKLLPREIRL